MCDAFLIKKRSKGITGPWLFFKRMGVNWFRVMLRQIVESAFKLRADKFLQKILKIGRPLLQ